MASSFSMVAVVLCFLSSSNFSKGTSAAADPSVKFLLLNQTYLNNSVVAINVIGEIDNAVLCVTDKSDCCKPSNGPKQGEFYYPNGSLVPNVNSDHSLYRDRGEQFIRLNRRNGVLSPTGVYRCEIPDSTGMNQSIYITITVTAITCMPLSVQGIEGIFVEYSPDSRDSSGNYFYGTVATYTCSYGFTLNGVQSRTCVGDGDSIIGMFNGADSNCEVITCETLSEGTNGMIMYSTGHVSEGYRVNTTATYQCNNGFSLVGEEIRTCIVDGSSSTGTWNGHSEASKCSAITCTQVDDISNGRVQYSTQADDGQYSFGTVANFSCSPGFIISGPQRRVCVGAQAGIFDGSNPTCIAKSVYLTLRSKTYYTNNSDITITEIGPEDSSSLICHTDSSSCCRGMDNPVGDNGFGSWLYPNGSAIQKETTSSPANGFVWSRGTQLVRLNRRGSVTFPLGTYCCVVPDGTSMNRTFCANLVAIICMPLTVEGGGGISVSYSPDRRDGNGNYYYGTAATYSCSLGYGLSGGRNRMCVGGDSSSSVGIFNGNASTCERITCSPPSNIANGKIMYSTDTTPPYDFNTTATYQCDDGFSLVGERLRTCGDDDSSSNGVWSGKAPRCPGITCSSPPVLGNGSITFTSGNQQPPYDVNTIATHSCNQGFQLVQGNRERTCVGVGSSVAGSWSGSRPMCKGVQVSVSVMSFVVGQEATIQCVPDITATSILWKKGDVVISRQDSATFDSLSLTFSPVSDSIDGTTYVCEAILSGSGSQPSATSNITVTVEVPANPISTSIIPSSMSSPTVGSEFSMTCTVTKDIQGLMNIPLAQWFHDNQQLMEGSASVNGVLVITFRQLYTSHSGVYMCRGSISSLQQSHIVNRAHSITLKIPDPTVSITGQSPQNTLYSGFSNQIFVCEVRLHANVDTDVQININWTRALHNGSTVTSMDTVLLKGSSTVKANSSRYTLDDLSSSDDMVSCSATVVPTSKQEYLSSSGEVIKSTILMVEGVYLVFDDKVLSNNTNIMIDDLGNTPAGQVRCHSDRENCCHGDSQINTLEQWRFPNGSTVQTENGSILVTRESGHLRLSRVDNVTNPGGQYCCDAQDNRGKRSTICINVIHTSDNSNIIQAVIGGAIAGVLFVILLATAVVILVIVVMRRKVQLLNIQMSGAKVEIQSVPLSEVNQSVQYETVAKEYTEPHVYETIATDHEYEVVRPRERDQAEQTKQQEGVYNLTDCPAYLPTNTVREAPVVSSEEERAA